MKTGKIVSDVVPAYYDDLLKEWRFDNGAGPIDHPVAWMNMPKPCEEERFHLEEITLNREGSKEND